MNRKASGAFIAVLLVAFACVGAMLLYIINENQSVDDVFTKISYSDVTTQAVTETTTTSAYTPVVSVTEISPTETVPTVTTTSESTTEATTQSTAPASPTDQTQTSRTWEQVPKNKKIAYLTFDDGPSKNTKKILKILDQYDVKATFFVIGKKNLDSEYKAIAESGNTIALHSYTHSYSVIYKSEKGYFDDLQKISDKVFELTGVRSQVVRFPGGSSNTVHKKYCKGIMPKLEKALEEKGYVYHDWNVDSGDATGSNVAVDKLLRNIKNDIGSKNVIDILMHDTGDSKNTTVEALPKIIEYLKEKGFEMRTLTPDVKPVQHGKK